MNSRLSFLLKAIIMVAILFSNNLSFSQINTGGMVIDSSAVKPPEAIPVIDVIQKIEEENEKTKLTEKKIKPKKSVLEIDSLLPPYSVFLDEQKIKSRAFVKANPNRQKVDNLIAKWVGFHDHLNSWESTINNYEEKNAILIKTISFDEVTWDLTYQNAKEEKVPAEVLNSINNTWAAIKKNKKAIINENNYFLKLESRINKQKIIVAGVIDDLNTLKNSEVYDLFYLRHPTLWNTSFRSLEDKSGEDGGMKTISKNVAGTLSFLKNNENNFYLYFLVVGLIVLLFVFLKKTYIKYEFNEENASLQKAKDVILNHSISGSIFLSLVIANQFFKSKPMLFANILLLLILIASIPLVQPYIYNRFKKLIYFLVLFFILDSAKTYIWFTSGQYRVYLLIEALLVITVLFIFTHPYLKTRKMKIGKFGLLLIRMTPVMYLLSIVSIVSNVLGYTNLTDLTLKITTQSAEIAVVFYGLLLLAFGISTGLLHYHFSIKDSYSDAVKLKTQLKVMQIIRFVAFVSWFIFFLKMVDLYKPIIEWLTEKLTEPYIMGSITFTIGAIVSFILILTVSYLITSFISFLIDGGSLKALKLPKGVPAAISMVIRYFIIAFGFVLALSALGMDFSKFNLMAGALGIGIGFGLQNIVSNFISGIILVFERPILVGDTVEVNNLLGTVSNIGVRASNIRTFDGAEVVVPNNNLIANDLINWTLSDNVKRIEILIGTTYSSDPNEILKVLTEVAINCKYALKSPPPKALFSEFGESSLNFRLLFWVHYEVGLQAKSDVSIDVYNKFKELGIEIPFPQRDIYIKDLPKDDLGIDHTIKAQIKSKTKQAKIDKPLIEPQIKDKPENDEKN